MAKTSLTPRQMDCYKALAAYITEHGQSPSIEELQTMTGLKAKSGVLRLLDGLEERGWIHRMRFRARAISLVSDFEVINLKDPMTQAFLIENGWTPPSGGAQC